MTEPEESGGGHFDDVVVLVPNFQSTLASIVITIGGCFLVPLWVWASTWVVVCLRQAGPA